MRVAGGEAKDRRPAGDDIVERGDRPVPVCANAYVSAAISDDQEAQAAATSGEAALSSRSSSAVSSSFQPTMCAT